MSAAGYFQQAVEVSVEASQLSFRVYYTPPTCTDGTVMVCHHGAGYSGLSFACFAKEVTSMTKGECGVLAMDARRHGVSQAIFNCECILLILLLIGKTKPLNETVSDENLSVDVLADDAYNLLRTIFSDPTKAPSLLVCLTMLAIC